MAKYTELFSEWLANGGQLPAIFNSFTLPYWSESDDENDGLGYVQFADIFKAHFADREIGFETPELFEMKLSATAQIYLPYYWQKIKDLWEYRGKLMEGATGITRTHTGEIQREYGDRQTREYNLPAGAPLNGDGNPEPDNITDLTHQPQYTDREIYNEDKQTETGMSTSELLNQYRQEYNAQVESMTEIILSNFDNLFMQVY